MSFKVALREVETGEIRIHDQPEGTWDDPGGKFNWTENNYSCDCNRYLWFERAAGHEPTDEEDERYGDCGHERYRIAWIEAEDGTKIYPEDSVPNVGVDR